jgi:c-di-GMP-related signal transduction protein
VGSVACPVRTQIQSIRHAAILSGIDRLKIWAALILALTHHEGTFGETLKCVIAYERRAWVVRCGSLDSASIRDAYIKAMSWSIQTLTGFSEAIAEDAVRKENLKHLRR